MKSDLFVSILINNYNYEAFITKAIDSALNQLYPNIEVIVVDDGSTDRSREIIRSYGNRIIPVFQENGKQAAALNSGFEIAKGDLVMFLDADDSLLPHAIQTIVNQWPLDIVKTHFRLKVVGADDSYLGYTIPSETITLSGGDVVQELLRCGQYVSTPMSGNAYKREAIASLFPIPEEYSTTADDYLMISTPFCGLLHSIEEPLGCYRIHNSNQWALTMVTGSRFRRFVTHDLQNFSLLQSKAEQRALEVPQDLEMRAISRIWSRIASLRLEPQHHPIPQDNALKLMYFGLRALWKYSEHNRPKRFIYSIFVIWVCTMPKPLVQTAYTWLYAPHLRSKTINNILTSIRSLIS